MKVSKYSLFWGLVALLAILGFAVHVIFTQPNIRWFIKGNIKAWGNISKGNEVSYFSLDVGNENVPYFEAPPSLCIILNEKQIQASQLEASELLKLKGISVRETGDRRWPEGTRVYSVGGYSFYIHAGKIYRMSIQMCFDQLTKKELNPKVAKLPGDNVYEFPLTEQILRELLGDPDEIIDSFHS